MASSNTKPVTIREFSLPTGDLRRKVLITGVIMLLSSRREVIAPGSPLYDYVLSRDTRLLTAARWIQNGLFYFLFIAHAIEVPLFAWTRLRKHNVPFGLDYVKWLLSEFVGGKFTTEHFDKLAARRAAEAAAKGW